jgi:calcineurin-like phosphoesterase family protein
MKYWFTADLHLGHANIIKFCSRPYKSIEQMDDALIRNWNSRVQPDDIIFIIGDFCYRNNTNKNTYARRLVGKPIFIRGNHDKNNATKTSINYIGLSLGGKSLLLIHDPAEAFGTSELTLCGHVHQNWKFKTTSSGLDCCNVGVDVWGFRPICIEEILKEYETWKLKRGR